MTHAPTPSVHFLLVDDLEENLLALEALLRRDHLTLLKAKSGKEALELLLKHEVALALIDVRMPEMDGFELAELMRGAERTRRTPIIFLTAGAPDRQRRFRGYEAGAVDFLQKPIEPDILRSKADVFFELYRQRQEVARQRDELKAMIEENARLLEETRQYAQALKEADRRKDEFLATLAHELRNPLAPILHAAQALRLEGLTPAKRQELREMIERQAGHMTRLVDDLLDVSRITRGKIDLRLGPAPLAEVVQSAFETSKPLLQAGKHQWSVTTPSEPLVVEGDMVRLTQVVSNLLNNAAKYTPEGGFISVSVERDGDSAVIRVRDTGLGIPSEMLSQVFDMFTQVNQHLNRSQGGLGIGLTLVKGLVEMHGGTITVHSEGEGRGAEFIVRLPLADRPVEPSQRSADDRGAAASTTRRILVVDDNMDAADSLAMLLAASGHEVATAYDGRAAVAKAADFKPNLTLLDLGMPEVDGYETARLLRGLPGGREIVLAALTGWGQQEDRSRTREVGFDFHLVKPVDPAILQEVLASLDAR